MPTEAELTAQLAAAKAETDALKNKVEVLSAGANDLESLSKKNQEMESKLQAIEADNKRLALERDKESVLKQYPKAMPQFVTGANKAEMEANAKLMHEKIEAEAKLAAETREKELGQQWNMVTPGGQGGMTLNANEIDEKYKKAQEGHNIVDMLKAKFEKMKFKKATA